MWRYRYTKFLRKKRRNGCCTRLWFIKFKVTFPYFRLRRRERLFAPDKCTHVSQPRFIQIKVNIMRAPPPPFQMLASQKLSEKYAILSHSWHYRLRFPHRTLKYPKRRPVTLRWLYVYSFIISKVFVGTHFSLVFLCSFSILFGRTVFLDLERRKNCWMVVIYTGH